MMIRLIGLILLGLVAWSVQAAPPPCIEDANTACLHGGQFRVTVSFDGSNAVYVPPAATPLSGEAAFTALTDDTALFSFYGTQQFDLAVKVLNGCPLNGHYWVFAALPTDTGVTLTIDDVGASTTRVYFSPAGAAASPIADTSAFAGCPSTVAAGDTLPSHPTAAAKGVCAHLICLQGGRLGLDVSWRDFADNTGNATALAESTDQSALLWLFSAANLESLVTVIDGRTDNGAFWFLASAISNVEISYTLTDTMSGRVNNYLQPLGSSRSLLDRGDPLTADFMPASTQVAPGDTATLTLRLQNPNSGSREFRSQMATPSGASNPRFTCTATAPALCPAASGTGTFDQTGSIPGDGALTYLYQFDVATNAPSGSMIPVAASTTTLADALAGDRTTVAQAQVNVASAAAAIAGPVLVPGPGRFAILVVLLLLAAAALLRLSGRGV